jgi:hypothetical protein
MNASVKVLSKVPVPAEFGRFDEGTPMHEKTPGSISNKIVNFCDSLNSGPPQFLPVAPTPGSRIGMCADNVMHIVRQQAKNW